MRANQLILDEMRGMLLSWKNSERGTDSLFIVISHMLDVMGQQETRIDQLVAVCKEQVDKIKVLEEGLTQ